eukprot:1000265-Prymnesium_polylepis.1
MLRPPRAVLSLGFEPPRSLARAQPIWRRWHPRPQTVAFWHVHGRLTGCVRTPGPQAGRLFAPAADLTAVRIPHPPPFVRTAASMVAGDNKNAGT